MFLGSGSPGVWHKYKVLVHTQGFAPGRLACQGESSSAFNAPNAQRPRLEGEGAHLLVRPHAFFLSTACALRSSSSSIQLCHQEQGAMDANAHKQPSESVREKETFRCVALAAPCRSRTHTDLTAPIVQIRRSRLDIRCPQQRSRIAPSLHLSGLLQ